MLKGHYSKISLACAKISNKSRSGLPEEFGEQYAEPADFFIGKHARRCFKLPSSCHRRILQSLTPPTRGGGAPELPATAP